ncbi:inosine monophosphate cyclohydrolase [Paenibacillus rhizovicinus]|uniref:Inosine monophosphate cyclohydrolase n=1 Tax=Paenibacillus rhizovicinus TaxID=2704463 RepID=A0A6C0P483_9BACL|nr:IMP cyclohydrolase [Paenibacillus rhizovicinus]QHW31482.1 inosine monophosphate cyclohydrolase [Paenibacillus rhizovicinus]
MSTNTTTKWQALADATVQRLQENSYPGRGIVIGLTPDATRYVQVYWIMGRSENSRNRVFIPEANGFLRTEARDPAKLTDPSLIIYYPLRHEGGAHIVTNGDQTDTIWDSIKSGGSFEQALGTRTYEPDPPNFTPRISGIVDLNDAQNAYKLSILKSNENDESQTKRQYFHYEQAIAGFGHFISTYVGDGNPLPSFAGEPQVAPLFDDAQATADFYWNLLDADNKISLLVKTIRISDGETTLTVVNRPAEGGA